MLVLAVLGHSALPDASSMRREAQLRAIARGLAPIARTHQLVVLHAGAPATSVGQVANLLGLELQNALPDMGVASLLAHCVLGNGRDPDAAGRPFRLQEIGLLRRLLEDPNTVPCLGVVGVQLDARGALVGAAPLFDVDEAAAAIATELGADVMLLLGDADAVYRDWPDRQAPVVRLDATGDAPVPATIARKVEAACAFARNRGTFAVIGRADRGVEMLAGRAGTCVVAGG